LCGWRRRAVPDLLDQLVARHDIARVKQEQRQQGPLLAAPKLQRAAVLEDVERAKDAELHASIEQRCNKVATGRRHAHPVADGSRKWAVDIFNSDTPTDSVPEGGAMSLFSGKKKTVAALCWLSVAPAASCLWVSAAGADATYHTAHIALLPIGGAPLRSGFVQNIHANGPNIAAREMYQLNGAEPNTSYRVAAAGWFSNTSCSGSPTVRIPDAVLTTDVAGNGVADHVFTPEDVSRAGLHGVTFSVVWTLFNGTTAAYTTDCEVITAD
jgi:hypothetical protein